MFELLRNIAAFLVVIGVLVAFHEFGHFWVARRLGVKVLRYSIGFGKPLWTRTGRDGCEYAISAIPLGGYVKMLDEREGEVPAGQLHLAFNRQSPYKRLAIVAAGPVANFLLAIVVFWAVYVIGEPGLRPVVAEPVAQSAAAKAGVQAGEVVTRVNGEPVATWNGLRTALLEKVVNRDTLVLDLQSSVTDESSRRLAVPLDAVRIEPEYLFDDLGLTAYQPKIPPVLDEIVAGAAAEHAGLMTRDRVTAIDEVAIGEWADLVNWVRAHPGANAVFTIEREGVERRVPVVIGVQHNGGYGYQLRSFLGRLVPAFAPKDAEATNGWLGAGVKDTAELRKRYGAIDRLSPFAAVPAAVVQTWRTSALTVKMLGKMLTGEVSLKNVSGAISIAQAAGITASIGIATFLGFIALVSVSLGVLNLLPVPLLDGGHLLYYTIEIIKGSPLSESVMAMGQRVGLTFLMLLMGLAFYNDLSRLVG